MFHNHKGNDPGKRGGQCTEEEVPSNKPRIVRSLPRAR